MTKQSNLATAAALKASSVLNPGYGASNLTDGKLTNESRWVSGSKGPHTLPLTWATPQTIACLQLGTGWLNEGVWGSEFRSLSVRDGTYYSYEVPSLVMLYLANPSFFEQAKREVEWKPLAANFKQVKAAGDGGALEAAQAYFRAFKQRRTPSGACATATGFWQRKSNYV